jgi:hypothetical protein
MSVPRRLQRQEGRHALVDGIPFALPVGSRRTPALMAAFSIDADRARALLPGREIHPLRLWNRGLLVVTVVDYVETTIGRYIEFSIAIACTRGERPAPRLLPGLLMDTYGTGQFVYDLPVSTDVSVKGGKGIWGMPKHRANLDFQIGERAVSSQYDLDGEFMMKIEVERRAPWLPLSTSGVNYCAFRGMLMKSYVYFKGPLGFSLMRPGSARLTLGNHGSMRALRELDIRPTPLFAGYFPETQGVLDDHFECWFLDYPDAPAAAPPGLETVVGLPQDQAWLPAPTARPPADALVVGSMNA